MSCGVIVTSVVRPRGPRSRAYVIEGLNISKALLAVELDVVHKLRAFLWTNVMLRYIN